jgi:hypothetical protein
MPRAIATGSYGITVLVRKHCGTYSGTESGKFLVVVSGGVASGVAAQDGRPESITLGGTASSTHVTLTWAWDTGNGTAGGVFIGPDVSGTWSNTTGHNGIWSGTNC